MASRSIIPEMALYSNGAGDTRNDAISDRRSFTSGVLTQPPSIKLLISALAEKVSNEPSREDSLMCEALRFPSSEVKPPTWNSATETMSAG